jgi:tetratricopeptide (TPR) repeat protein
MEVLGGRQNACASLVALAYGSDAIGEDAGLPFELVPDAAAPNSWNERFQRLLAKHSTSEDMATLAKEFAEASERLCRTIVEEMFAVQRTVAPRNIGGLAGGPKFVEGGIFVKLSCDWKNIYGGDSWAIKSASQELLAVETYLDLRVKGLHFPLVALVLYRGHALLCQSILPISPQTLQHGSHNAGQTVLNESPALENRLKVACDLLRLAPHNVSARNKTHSRMLYTAADMEGHLGADGRFYLLDCSRAFPPTAPRVGEPASRFLARHMRPEAVKKWSGGPPLSADAFSNFKSTSVEEMRKHNQNVIDATKWLESQLVPEFAAFLDAKVCSSELHSSGGGASLISNSGSGDVEFDPSNSEDEGALLVSDMHVRGINVRYLGLVLSRLKQSASQSLVLCEMAARTVKHIVFEAWRKIESNAAEEFVAVAQWWLQHLERDDAVWAERLVPRMASYFLDFPKEYLARARELRSLLAGRMSLLLSRVELQIGFVDGRVVPRVKHLSRVSFEQGLSLAKMASLEPDAGKQKTLLLQAATLFRALKHDRRAVYNHALILSKLGKLCVDISFYHSCFEVARSLLRHGEEPDDLRALFLLGSSQMDAAKLPLAAPEKQSLLFSAKDNLERAVALSLRQHLPSLFCLGQLDLVLVRFLGGGQHELGQLESLLRDAVSCFEDSLEIDCRSVNAMVNLAVAKSKLARVTRDSVTRDRLFEGSFRNYENAATMVQQPSLYFDWANSLYRCAKEKLACGDQRDAAGKFFKAASCYAKSLQLKRSAEAWINLGVALEKCATMAECSQDELVPLMQLYLSLHAFDLKRSETVRSKVLRASTSAKLRHACTSGNGAITLSGSLSPGEPMLKQSDEFLDADHDTGRPRRGSILTGYSAKAEEYRPTAPSSSLSLKGNEYATLVRDNSDTYIAPNTNGPSFQGDTVHL